MKSISRKLTSYSATAYTVSNEGGVPSLVEFAKVDYLSTTPDERSARRAFKDAGVELPHGAILNIEQGETKLYKCTLDAFLSVATCEE